jgi:hypothetical protein
MAAPTLVPRRSSGSLAPARMEGPSAPSHRHCMGPLLLATGWLAVLVGWSGAPAVADGLLAVVVVV